MKGNIRFDRNELAGAFGDIGTDLPLIIGMILINDLNPASTLIMFGFMQIASAFFYGIPMAVQPLKVMAIIMLTQKLDKSLLYGAGLSVGIVMFILAASGLLNKMTQFIAKPVVRGIQCGLGITLASLAMTKYIHADGVPGYVLSALSFILIIFLLNN